MAEKAKSKKGVEVKIEIPIHNFGFFTFEELGSAQKVATKTKRTPIYVFPKSTAALAQA